MAQLCNKSIEEVMILAPRSILSIVTPLEHAHPSTMPTACIAVHVLLTVPCTPMRSRLALEYTLPAANRQPF
jgi:hypothetical protein